MAVTVKTIIVCLMAGLGAGLGTGFAGLSAAAVISPVLVTFLGVDAYMAVGIALASDVLASASSAVTYKRKGNLDVKNGFAMMIAVMLFTVVGSFAAKHISGNAMGNTSVIATTFIGLRFLLKPVMKTREDMLSEDPKARLIKSVFAGVMVGFICGFVGAGGGMMMLFVLTSIVGYELKTAVGTSTFIMAFTAFTGAVSHFAIKGEKPDLLILSLCVLFTLVFAKAGALIANKVSNIILNRIVGGILVIMGIVLMAVRFMG
ncbi:MAG: sulfite exporter TauE/SafE family protein [Clostridia bacterium]|nr:sulfite exporter TauE/SafE family protein [Clostridia bacterium]